MSNQTKADHVSIHIPESKDDDDDDTKKLVGPNKGLIRRTSSYEQNRKRVNRVLRVISSGLGGSKDTKDKDIQCTVCWGGSGTVVMKDCPTAKSGSLKHGMCLNCAKTYLTLQIKEKRVQNIRCPMYGSDDCSATAHSDFVKAHVDPSTYEKYQRFLKVVEDPSLRECPVCKELVKPKIRSDMKKDDDDDEKTSTKCDETKDNVIAEMKCSVGHEFCYYHSAAHAPGIDKCAAYTIEQAKEERLANASLGDDVKPCPHCKAKIFKIEGCNHMTCGACKKHFCWTCGKAVTPGPQMAWHYSTSNPYGCLQLEDMTLDELNSSLTMFMRVLALPGTIIGHLLFWVFSPFVIPTVGIAMLVSIIAVLLFQLAYYLIGILLLICVIVPILSCFDVSPSDAQSGIFLNAPITAWVAACELFTACCPCCGDWTSE